jgi:hypothetical protein
MFPDEKLNEENYPLGGECMLSDGYKLASHGIQV